MLEYCFKRTEEGRTTKSLSAALAVCGLALAVSGCAGLDEFVLRRTRTDRQRILNFYGECLQTSRGDLITIARYCNSVAETRRAREKAAAPAWYAFPGLLACPCE